MNDLEEDRQNVKIISNSIKDSPVNDFNIDFFGYKPVAKEVARSIASLNTNFGYVIAINGKWGSGKTSFLFYIEKYLTERKSELKISNTNREVIVFRFDPWLFSGHQDIVSQFFMQLQAQCEVFPKKKISDPTLDVLKQIFEYGSKLRAVPTLESQMAGWGFAGMKALIESRLNESMKSIYELRDKIKNGLQKINDIIVIIIDDIDRLTPQEIRELFRAIKAVADFPNIVYVLAYDEEVVTSALDYEFNVQYIDLSQKKQSRSGIKYLEKIIHFSIHIPVIGEQKLKGYTDEVIFDKKFLSTKNELLDKDRWDILYFSGINHFLKTPRTVIRLHNALTLLYPPIENEVNVVDFIALEIIRQNHPVLYNEIKDNPSYFIREGSLMSLILSLDMDKERVKNYHQSWITTINKEDREPIAEIISDIFPDVSEYLIKFLKKYNNPHRPIARELNICLNYDTFLKYFRYQIEPDLFSTSDLTDFLSNIKDTTTFPRIVLKLSRSPGREESRAYTFLKGLYPLIDQSVPENSLENLIIGIFQIEDEVLIFNDNKNKIPFQNKEMSDLIEDVRDKAIDSYPKGKRLLLLKRAFSKGSSLYLEASLINIIRPREGDKVSVFSKYLLDENEVKEIGDIFIKKVQEEFTHDKMKFAGPEISHIIYVFNKLKPNDEILGRAISSIWQNEDILIKIIHASQVNKYIRPIAPFSLEPFIPERELRQEADRLLNEKELTEGEKSSLENFLKITKQG